MRKICSVQLTEKTWYQLPNVDVLSCRYRGRLQVSDFSVDHSNSEIPSICSSTYDVPEASNYNLALITPYDSIQRHGSVLVTLQPLDFLSNIYCIDVIDSGIHHFFRLYDDSNTITLYIVCTPYMYTILHSSQIHWFDMVCCIQVRLIIFISFFLNCLPCRIAYSVEFAYDYENTCLKISYNFLLLFCWHIS